MPQRREGEPEVQSLRGAYPCWLAPSQATDTHVQQGHIPGKRTKLCPKTRGKAGKGGNKEFSMSSNSPQDSMRPQNMRRTPGVA